MNRDQGNYLTRSGKHAQLALTLGTQGLASGSNIAFLLLVSHVASAQGFGTFSLLYGVYIFAIGLARAFVTDPLLLSAGSEDIPRVLSSGMMVGAIFGLLLAASTAVIDLPVALVFGFAVSLPGILMQDAYRSVAFRERRSGTALLLDGSWGLAQVIATILLAVFHDLTVVTATLAWGAGAYAAVAVGVVWTRRLPRGNPLTWLISAWRTGLPLSVDFVAGAGATQIALALAAAATNPAAAGGLRIIQVALGPMNVLAQGLYAWALPRLALRRPEERFGFGVRVSLSLAAVACAVGAALLLAPNELLISVFGSPWKQVSFVLLVVMVAERVVQSAGTGTSMTARSLGHVGSMASARVTTGLSLIFLTYLLTRSVGIEGAAVALLSCTSMFCVAAYLLAKKDPRPDLISSRDSSSH